MSDAKKRLGERLIEEGLITAEGLNQALELQKRFGGRLGECLLELKLLSEGALLKFLAAEYKTRYVATEKLAKVKIPQDVLDKIPVRMAEQQQLIPIMIDPTRKVISIVMAEPQNLAVLEEIRLVSEMNEVYAYIAAKSGVLAAIKKHYYGDPTAFDTLDAVARQDAQKLADYYDHSGGTDPNQVSFGKLKLPTETSPNIQLGTGTGTEPRLGAGPTSIRQAIDEVHRASLMSDNDFVETLNILVGLLELRRKELRGHSASVARHARTVAQKLLLPARDINYIIIASYLHDLGKRPDRHLTLMSLRAREDFGEDARKSYLTPTKLFETVHLPVQVNSILGHLYECFDGTGLPEGAAGESIPMGARIIAAVDAYEDLTKNALNALGMALGKDEALERMESYSGSLFDPSVIEVLKMIHSGELLKQRLLGSGKRILLVDPNERDSAKLEGQLADKGYLVETARSSEAAAAALRNGSFDLVISEVEVQPENGFLLCAGTRKEARTHDLPFLFVSARNAGADIERGLAVGANDYVVKPANLELLVGKVSKLLAARAAQTPPEPVSGSLDEMGIDAILRTVASAKRSGALQVRGEDKSATIWFEGGRIVQLTAGELSGEEAFNHLTSMRLGEFSLDPSAVPPSPHPPLDVELLFRAQENARRARAAGQAPEARDDRTPVGPAPERPARGTAARGR